MFRSRVWLVRAVHNRKRRFYTRVRRKIDRLERMPAPRETVWKEEARVVLVLFPPWRKISLVSRILSHTLLYFLVEFTHHVTLYLFCTPHDQPRPAAARSRVRQEVVLLNMCRLIGKNILSAYWSWRITFQNAYVLFEWHICRLCLS